jgi:hypothetical protein
MIRSIATATILGALGCVTMPDADVTPSICAVQRDRVVALACSPIDDDSCEYQDPTDGRWYEASWSDTCPASYCEARGCVLFTDRG